MDSLDTYVRKNGMQEVVNELNRIQSGEVEHHDFVKDKKISADDWFEFLWEIRPALGRGSVVSDFNYLRVGAEAVKYVDDNGPVEFDRIVQHVSSEVESADEDDVDSWLGNMMARNMKVEDDTGKVKELDYLFEYTKEEYAG